MPDLDPWQAPPANSLVCLTVHAELSLLPEGVMMACVPKRRGCLPDWDSMHCCCMIWPRRLRQAKSCAGIFASMFETDRRD